VEEDDGAVGCVLLSELAEVWVGVWAAEGVLSIVIEALWKWRIIADIADAGVGS